MRVIVNQWSAGARPTGIGHYTAQLVDHLRALPGTHEVVDFPPPWAGRLLGGARKWLEGGPPKANSSPPSGLGRLRRKLKKHLVRCGRHWIAWQFRHTCASFRCQLYHEPNYLPQPCDLPTVATFHDLSVLLHPEWHPRDRVRHFERNLPAALARCQHFFTVSEFSRREMIRHLNVPPERVTVTYNGNRPHLRPVSPAEVAGVQGRLGLPQQYLLHVGTIEPRKNLLMLMRAYGALPAELRRRCPLLLVGRWGWRAEPVAEYLERRGRADGVLHLGYVAESDLAGLYAGARALVLPSHYEGFGMPAAEMLACGGAVLTSTAEALAEVAGARAALVDPRDEHGWRDALHRLISDDGWRDELRRDAVPRALPFTWQRCAADTLRVYRQVCGLPVEPAAPATRAA